MAPVDHFPHPESASPDGLLAIGGDLHPQSLLKAYRAGIFPWPIEDLPLTWFSPPQRAVLYFKNLHIPRRLQQRQRHHPYTFTISQNFKRVIEGCAKATRPLDPRAESSTMKTWITDEMVEAYCRLHQMGHAHSVEVWHKKKLVGGIYGVQTEGCFSCESMFYTESDASKLALLKLIEELKTHGFDWMDIQMMTPHMERLGAEVIPRKKFLQLMEDTAELRPRPLIEVGLPKIPWEQE